MKPDFYEQIYTFLIANPDIYYKLKKPSVDYEILESFRKENPEMARQFMSLAKPSPEEVMHYLHYLYPKIEDMDKMDRVVKRMYENGQIDPKDFIGTIWYNYILTVSKGRGGFGKTKKQRKRKKSSKAKFGVIYIPTPTDAAKVYAKRHAIDLRKIKGSGAGGRILLKDVQKPGHYVSDAITKDALEMIHRHKVPINKIRGTGHKRRITTKDVKQYMAVQDRGNIKKFLIESGLKTSFVLVLSYFLKVGTYPFTKTGALNQKALKQAAQNDENPRIAMAARHILEVLKLGFNPRFFKILETLKD